jgi:mono/diheme cytochrome c family protein
VLQTVLDGREGVMPEWGKVLTGMGGRDAVDYVAAYVRTLPQPAAHAEQLWRAQGKSCTKACASVATASTARATRTSARPT